MKAMIGVMMVVMSTIADATTTSVVAMRSNYITASSTRSTNVAARCSARIPPLSAAQDAPAGGSSPIPISSEDIPVSTSRSQQGTSRLRRMGKAA